MSWPPKKAWTSVKPLNGFRHFVAINYGGKSKDKWVKLVAVLDGNTILRISWIEMQDSSKWLVGWPELPSYSLGDDQKTKSGKDDFQHQNLCLHSSIDSGLAIPCIDETNIRSWF